MHVQVKRAEQEVTLLRSFMQGTRHNVKKAVDVMDKLDEIASNLGLLKLTAHQMPSMLSRHQVEMKDHIARIKGFLGETLPQTI